MTAPLTVLFTSAGRRNQLIRCFREDARRLGIELRAVAADLRPDLSPACQQADARFAVPRCTHADYVPAVLEICRHENVQILVPTIDPELAPLGAARTRFAELGTRVVVSSDEVVRLAGDKLATARALAAAGVPTPATLSLSEYRSHPASLGWPVIAKPRTGSASIGVIRPRNKDELMSLTARDYVVQELATGNEYTVNVYFDHTGRLRCAIPHLRIEVRSGEVSKGRTERVLALIDAAQKLADVLPGAYGPLCFQGVLAESGQLSIFEINARFGGGYPLAHRAGARFSQWLLEDAIGRPSSACNDWSPGVVMLRYDDAVFLDA